MNIINLLQKNTIIMNLASNTKVETLRELIAPISYLAKLDINNILNLLIQRERARSTGIENGVAIFHCKIKRIEKSLISFGLSKNGIKFKSLDEKNVHVFFLLISSEKKIKLQLEILSCISKLALAKNIKNIFLKVQNKNDLISIFTEKGLLF